MTKVLISCLCCLFVVFACQTKNQEKETPEKGSKKKNSTSETYGEPICIDLFCAYLADSSGILKKLNTEEKIVCFKKDISFMLSKHLLDSSYHADTLSKELAELYINQLAQKQMCRPVINTLLKNHFFYSHLSCDEYDIVLRGTLQNQHLYMASCKFKPERSDEAKAFVNSLKKE